ncbi:hypothetical protein AMTR_s05456p00002370, partial [Amborella trichopoda]
RGEGKGWDGEEQEEGEGGRGRSGSSFVYGSIARAHREGIWEKTARRVSTFHVFCFSFLTST